MESSSTRAADFGFSPIQMSPAPRAGLPWVLRVAPRASAGPRHPLGSGAVPASLITLTEPRRTVSGLLREDRLCTKRCWQKIAQIYPVKLTVPRRTCCAAGRSLALCSRGLATKGSGWCCCHPSTSNDAGRTECEGRAACSARQNEASLGGLAKPLRVLPSHKYSFNHSFTFHNLNLQLRKQNIRSLLENEKKS